MAGEAAQLQQVILNLCTNAAQAIEGDGSIRIGADRREVAARLGLSHGELAPGHFVCLSVSDTGRGFDEGVARRPFEPFFTTRSAGTGLGLATVREIVRDHDAAMNVESRPGHGTRFEVWLACRAAPNRFDVVLISHTLATPDGLDVARALHALLPRQPKLLAIASTIDISLDALAEAGIAEVLHRPVDSTELAAVLIRCLRSDQQRYERNAIPRN